MAIQYDGTNVLHCSFELFLPMKDFVLLKLNLHGCSLQYFIELNPIGYLWLNNIVFVQRLDIGCSTIMVHQGRTKGRVEIHLKGSIY